MTETRWLSDDEREAWIALSAVILWLPNALDAQLTRDAGLSLAEYQMLSWLSMSPDRSARMGKIASLANITAPHASRVAGRLEKRGWLRREPDPLDGRATRAVLTEAGWDKVVASAPGHVEEVRRLVVDALTPDQVDQLRAVAESIARRCTGTSGRPGPVDAGVAEPA